MDNIYEITDDPPLFEKSKWIGQGKKYPSNPLHGPLELIYYCDSLLEIPSAVRQNYFPTPRSTVKAFLAYPSPKITYSLATLKPQQCFFKTQPNDDGTQLIQRKVPSKEWVRRMSAVLRIPLVLLIRQTLISQHLSIFGFNIKRNKHSLVYEHQIFSTLRHLRKVIKERSCRNARGCKRSIRASYVSKEIEELEPDWSVQCDGPGTLHQVEEMQIRLME